MSMHEVESYVELAIGALAASDLPLQHKRDLIYTLYDMEGQCDCGFTDLRNLDDLISCNYTFLFERTEMYDYTERQAFYDDIENEDAFDMGDVYVLLEEELDAFDGYDAGWVGKICVDSGSTAWEGMVRAGKITGAGAESVQLLDYSDVLEETHALIAAAYPGEPDEYSFSGLVMLFFMLGLEEDVSDEKVQAIFQMSKQELFELAGI